VTAFYDWLDFFLSYKKAKSVILMVGILLDQCWRRRYYYPFGLTMAGISSNALKGINYPENRMKFNGIELNTDLDLNSYEAHYRNLDPQIGRWWQIDPKPNDAVSPYAAMDNNPALLIDPLGDTTIYNENGKNVVTFGSKDVNYLIRTTMTTSQLGSADPGQLLIRFLLNRQKGLRNILLRLVCGAMEEVLT
jgi:RHS repeat-associated protein